MISHSTPIYFINCCKIICCKINCCSKILRIYGHYTDRAPFKFLSMERSAENLCRPWDSLGEINYPRYSSKFTLPTYTRGYEMPAAKLYSMQTILSRAPQTWQKCNRHWMSSQTTATKTP